MAIQTPSGIKPANTTDLVRRVAKITGVTQPEVKLILDVLLQSITQLATDTPYLKIREFGRFELRTYGQRMNRSPVNGGQVTEIPAREVLCFVAAKGMKEEVIY